MANHMEEVAKILGVELGEEFECDGEMYHFDHQGLKYNGFLASAVLAYLLNGKLTIKRKPWKPKDGETYWYVSNDGDIWENKWELCDESVHINYYKLGNCYRTQEETEANLDKWVKFYNSDEVLEV